MKWLPVFLIRSATIILAAAVIMSPPAGGDEPVHFNRDIRPILSEHCFPCHGPDLAHRQADLRLDDRDAAISAAALIPGNPEGSALWQRITSDDPEMVMPPPSARKPLSTEQRETIRRWISEGAGYQRHWSFETPARPVTNPGLHPIDDLLAATAAGTGTVPAPESELRTLIRRLSFDLTGLPPTPEAVAEFIADDSPDAWNTLIDSLLASPHYGERMALPWLDVVRFADTIGYHSDNPRNVWPWRDWVIQSFQKNRRFDDFTIAQLAGDLLPEGGDDALLGSAFNRLLLTTEEGGAQPKDYAQRMLADRVRAVGTVWLGLTTGCAQCHDHKFDPFTMRDFYSLAAYFADIDEPDIGRREDGTRVTLTEAHRTRRAELEAAVEAVRQQNDNDALAQAQARLAAFNGTLPQCLVTRRRKEPRPVRVLPRGNWMDESGPLVSPATPAFLNEVMTAADDTPAGPTRLDLARWLVRQDHPLTARVQMNRLWKQFFGTPLSRDSGDLGSQGEFPVQQPLLDWLACEFMDSGWDIRHMVRLLVTSAAYQRSAVATKVQLQADPENRYWMRQSSWRLEAELLRDNALAVAGLLDQTIGGPSVKPPQPDGYWDNLNFPPRKYLPDDAPARHRRGLYVWWQRTFLHPSLQIFDAPSREECCADRPRSNVPQQALVLLNDPIFHEAHRALAERVLTETGDEARIRRLWQLALQRDPDDAELAVITELLARQRSLQPELSDRDLWLHPARVLMNLQEFILRP